MKKSTPILLTIIAILFVAVLYLLYLNLNKTPLSTSTPVTGVLPVEKNITPTVVDETANWKTYTNTKYNFSFKYPNNYILRGFGGDMEGFPSEQEAIRFVIEGPYTNMDSLSGTPKLAVRIDITGRNPENNPEGTVIDNITPVKIDNVSAKKITGYVGGISGSVPFEYITYSIPSGNKFITLQLSSMVLNDPNKLSKLLAGDEDIFTQILSTFKFTSSTTESSIPKSISNFFAKVNKSLKLNLVPTPVTEFYSPSGNIVKKSWKLDLSNLAIGKSLIIFLYANLTPNNEGGGAGGSAIDGFENNQIKCSHSYGYRSGGPTNWTDPYDYLSCTEK